MNDLATEGYLQIRDIPFHYLDYGGTGRTVVLLHGLASNARFWDLAAPILARSFRVLALDQRGHGSSAKPDHGYDFPSVAADVAAFIDAMQVERPILVGHSWGGNVGMQVAADHPDILSALVCIDGGTIEPSAAPGATWEQTELALAPPDFVAMQLPWDAFLERAAGRATSDMWGGRLETFLRANFRITPDGMVLPQLAREIHMVIVRAIWDQRVSSRYPRITCPVLLMPARSGSEGDSSAGDTAAKEAAMAKAVSGLRQARVTWLEDSIHDVPVQRPSLVAQVIADAAADGFFGT